jgi:hypothetical protein
VKPKRLFLGFFMVLLVGNTPVLGQGAAGPGPKKARTVSDYTPRTWEEVANSFDFGVADGTEILTGNLFPSRLRATYRSSTRPLSQARKDVIFHWAQRYAGAPSHYTKQYETEVLFNEKDAGHWLVVKKNLLPRFEKEVRNGAAVDLYLIRLGAIRIDEKWEPVLLVESFAKP